MNIGHRLTKCLLSYLFGKTLYRRRADFVIGGKDNPYIRRWWVIPRNRWINIYLHRVMRDDEDRALHDHPWANVSILLQGQYREVVTGRPPLVRRTGDVVFRKASTLHRLELIDGGPCWSLFITGPKVRKWGFQCPRGWIPWDQFIDPNDPGLPGPGCPE